MQFHNGKITLICICEDKKVTKIKSAYIRALQSRKSSLNVSIVNSQVQHRSSTHRCSIIFPIHQTSLKEELRDQVDHRPLSLIKRALKSQSVPKLWSKQHWLKMARRKLYRIKMIFHLYQTMGMKDAMKVFSPSIRRNKPTRKKRHSRICLHSKRTILQGDNDIKLPNSYTRTYLT